MDANAQQIPLPPNIGVRGTPDSNSPYSLPEPVSVEVTQDKDGQLLVIEELNTKISVYADDREIWEQQPGEPSNYWSWFTTFRDMDSATRTISNAYRKITGKEVCWGVPDRYRLAWNLWSWKERALAYDQHVDRLHRRILEDVRLKARVETMKLGKHMREKAADALAVLDAVVYKNVLQDDGTVERVMRSALTPAQITKLAEIGVKLERLAVGEDNVGQAGFGVRTTAVQVNVRIGDDELVQRAQAVIESRQNRAPASTE